MLGLMVAAGGALIFFGLSKEREDRLGRGVRRLAEEGPHGETVVQAASESVPPPEKISRSAPSEKGGLKGPVQLEAKEDFGTFREFSDWVKSYGAAEEPTAREALLARGEALAKSRRRVLKELIKVDPKQALALALPEPMRRPLPGIIQRQLEKQINDRGNYRVAITCSFDEKKHEDEVSRQVTIGDRRYEAFVYGRRLHQVSKENVPLQGIAIDNSFAVQEDERPPGPSAGDVGGGTGDQQQLPVADNSYTQGTKRLLFIRVAFPDDPSEPITEAGAIHLMNQVNQVYVGYSYNTTSIISDVTPLLMLPQAKTYYSGQSVLTLQADARAAALGVGFDTANYDFDIVRNNPIPGSTFAFAGQASIGGKGLVLQNSLLYVVVHELGHNYGLWHANFWNASGDSIIGPGSTAEYGNTFDTMGSQNSDPASHPFNAEFKYHLQWLPGSFVRTVTSSGNYRIFAYDVPNLIGGQRYALRIKKDYAREYWGEFHQNLAGNPWTQNGILLNWSPFSTFVGNSLGGTVLLDSTAGTPSSNNGKDDAPVVIGHTFSDVAAGIHITPLATGVLGSDKWIDVQVNLGDFPSNATPTLAVAADQTSVAPGTTVSFTATAADGNGDLLAYYWDFGDQTFGSNAPTVSKSWSSPGEYVVRCAVSDMKGGVTSRSLVITVGSTGTFRVSGQVVVNGQPLEGVRIYNGLSGAAYRGVYTDGSGNYTLANLPAGSFNLFAVKNGYTIAASGFSNPVFVGPDLSSQNWIATAQPVLSIIAVDASASEVGLDPGALTVSRSGSLASPVTMRFNLSGGATYLTDYSLTPTPAMTSSLELTIPAGVASTNIVLTPLSDSLAEGPEDATLTIFEDPAYSIGSFSEATITIADSQAATPPVVKVFALDDSAPESGNDGGLFSFTRSNVGTGALTIHYSVSGSATGGVDYSTLSGIATIPAGQTHVEVSFNAIDDADVEGNETVIVTTTANAAYTVGNPASATATIVDDDPPTVTIVGTENIATEGGNPGTFTVTRNGSLAANLKVYYTMSGSATPGTDYSALSGALIILAGQVSADIPVSPLNDNLVEGTETAVATLLSNPGYNVGNPGSALVSISDDDVPSITLTASDPNASEAGPDTGTFMFSRSGSTADPLIVYFTVNGSAINGADYLPIGNSIVIPAGSASAALTVTPIDDAIKENSETVVITLTPSATSTYSAATITPQTVTISDDDNGGLVGVGFASATSSGREDEFIITVTVSLSAASSVPVTVSYAFGGGTATRPADYDYDPPQPLYFSPGTVTQSIFVLVKDDTLVEPAETIMITLNSPVNAVLDAFRTHTHTILDNDSGGIVSVTATDASASEAGPNTGTFRISRSGATIDNLTVNFQVTGSASSPSDYGALGNSVVIPAGQSYVDLVVTPVDDQTPEPMETVVLTLTSASGATIGSTNSATVFIADNDDSSSIPVVSVVASAPSASEVGPVPGTFTMMRNGNTIADLTVNYTISGTATNGSDYASIGTTTTIPAGSSTATITITPIPDAIAEPDENVVLTLTVGGTYRAAPAASSATVTIGNGPPPVNVGFTATASAVSENISPAFISVSLSASYPAPVTVHYAPTGGTAMGGGVDYTLAPGTLTFAPGETVKFIPITIIKDALTEPNKTVVVTLDSPTAATLGTSTFTLTIVDGATVTWDADAGIAGPQDGGGVWDTLGNPWLRAGANTPFVNGDLVTFGAGNGVAGTATITGANLVADGIRFNPAGSGTYSIATSAGETLTILGDGITSNESATLLLRTDINASQTWAVAAGKTLTAGSTTQFAGGFDAGETLVISGAGVVRAVGSKVLISGGASSTIRIDADATLEMNKGSNSNALYPRNATDDADATINLSGTGTLRLNTVGGNPYFAGTVAYTTFTGTIECAGDGGLVGQPGTKYRLQVAPGVAADLSGTIGSPVGIDGLTGSGALLQNNGVPGAVALNIGVNGTVSGGLGGTAQWDGAITTGGANTIDITKLGAGTQIFNGTDNRISGGSITTVHEGTLLVTKPVAISGADVAGRITVQISATLAVRAGGPGEWASANLDSILASAIFDVGSQLGIEVTGGNAFTHPDAIGGSLGLIKLGTGTLTLNGPPTYAGATTVSAGTLTIANAGLADSAGVNLTTGAILNLNFAGTDTIGELSIDGVPQFRGTWGGLSSGATFKTALITGTGILNVTAGPQTAFDTWAGANGLDNTAGKESAFDADPDRDGLANGLEWILGGNPLVSNAAVQPRLSTDDDNIYVAFTRDDASESTTALVLQWGSNLADWTDIPIAAASSGPDAQGIMVSVTENGAAPDTVVVTVPLSNAVSGKLFTRIKATLP